MASKLDLQVDLELAPVGQPGIEIRASSIEPRAFGRQIRQPLLQQPSLEVGEVVAQSRSLRGESMDLALDALIAIAVGQQRRQDGELSLRPLHRLVCLGE